MLFLLSFLLFAFALSMTAQTFGPVRPLLAPAPVRAPRVGLLVGGV